MIKRILSFIFLLFTFFVITNYSFGQTDWNRVNISTNSLNDIFFINNNIGWCCGFDGIFKTIDGGNNWSRVFSGKTLESIYFINCDEGWAVGDVGIILKSSNGGTSWQSQTSNTTNRLTSVFFTNSNSGWIVEYDYNNPHILKTTDSGKSWVKYSNSITAMDVYFVNDSVGFSSHRGISKTIDGGKTWIKKLNTISEGDFHGLHFINEKIGWASGCCIYQTIDGGETWKFKHEFGDYSNPPESFKNVTVSCYFVDENNGWSCGFNGSLFNTIDGGNSWTTLNSGVSETLNSVFFIDIDNGYVVGDMNFILKTGNGISNVLAQKYIHESYNFILYENYPNPFNPETTIKYHLSKSNNIIIKIYNIAGQEIETLVNKYQATGNHEITWQPKGLPSGIYFYKFQAHKHTEVRKLILQK